MTTFKTGDIVSYGPGQTRFTVTALRTLALDNGHKSHWVELSYPNIPGKIYRRADDLTLIQAAPRIVTPPQVRVLTKCIRVGDVLYSNGELLTIRMICGLVHERGKSSMPVHATAPDGTWREMLLNTGLTHELRGGPTYQQRLQHGRRTVGEIVDGAIKAVGQVA